LGILIAAVVAFAGYNLGQLLTAIFWLLALFVGIDIYRRWGQWRPRRRLVRALLVAVLALAGGLLMQSTGSSESDHEKALPPPPTPSLDGAKTDDGVTARLGESKIYLRAAIRSNADQPYTASTTVDPGDRLQLVVAVKNVGSNVAEGVVVGVETPAGTTLRPGSTRWNSALTEGHWASVKSDNLTIGGLLLGSYAPNTSVYVSAEFGIDEHWSCGATQVPFEAIVALSGLPGHIRAASAATVIRHC
jgi:uncharacterized repeat protein (TIGR01451 family)